MKKIYFILQHLDIGGIEICVINVANAFVKRGYKVVFLSLLRTNNLMERVNSDIEIEYLTSFSKGNGSLLYKLRRKLICTYALRKRLKCIKESVIVSTRNEYSILVSRFVSSDNLRIAQLHHDYIDRRGMVRDFRYRYTNIDYFFVLTDDIRKEVEDIMRKSNSHTKCVTIPNFYANEDQILTQETKRSDIAIAVGRLSKEKGFMRLLEIWNLIRKECGEKYKLYIIGDGDERSRLRQRIIELKLQNVVKLLGPLNHSSVIEWMQRANVYCMSSYTEAFSLVLLEAMNNGLPQVAFDVRVGPRNLMMDNKTGYLIEDGNLTDYASKTIKLFVDKVKWREMSMESLEHAKLFGEENVMKMWIKIIDNNM